MLDSPEPDLTPQEKEVTVFFAVREEGVSIRCEPDPVVLSTTRRDHVTWKLESDEPDAYLQKIVYDDFEEGDGPFEGNELIADSAETQCRGRHAAGEPGEYKYSVFVRDGSGKLHEEDPRSVLEAGP